MYFGIVKQECKMLHFIYLTSRNTFLLRRRIVPKREKSKRLQVVITEEQDSLLTKTAYQLSNPERLVSKSEVVRLGIEMLNKAVEDGQLDPQILEALEQDS